MTYFSLHSNHCSWFCRNKKAQLISPKWSRKFDDFAMISELFAVIQLSRMSLNWFLELFFSSCELDWGCSSDSEFDRWSCRVNFSLEAISQLDTWIMKVNANFQKKKLSFVFPFPTVQIQLLNLMRSFSIFISCVSDDFNSFLFSSSLSSRAVRRRHSLWKNALSWWPEWDGRNYLISV